jgi:hypothetical protein
VLVVRSAASISYKLADVGTRPPMYVSQLVAALDAQLLSAVFVSEPAHSKKRRVMTSAMSGNAWRSRTRTTELTLGRAGMSRKYYGTFSPVNTRNDERT